MDDRKIEELIGILKMGDWKARENAAKALGETADTRAVEPLIKALGDSEWYVRLHAAEALGKIGDARAVEPLIKILGDSDSDIQWRAAEALGKIGSSAVEPLIKALGDSDRDVRRYAANALGETGDAPAVEPLIKVLGDRDSGVRWSAAVALMMIGAPAVEPLIMVLGDGNPFVRWNSSRALGEIGDARAVESLIKALGDRDSDVRKGATAALDKLHWSPANETEKAYYLTAKQDWESVILLGTPAVEPLTRLLGDKDSNIKNKTTELLEKFCPQITETIFGELPLNNTKTCVKNLETSQLTIPMSGLTKILIDADTYDFDMVERFITYAINYVGQKHLRKKVEVYIYDNPDKLHPNLLNSFKNLCRKVVLCKK